MSQERKSTNQRTQATQPHGARSPIRAQASGLSSAPALGNVSLSGVCCSGPLIAWPFVNIVRVFSTSYCTKCISEDHDHDSGIYNDTSTKSQLLYCAIGRDSMYKDLSSKVIRFSPGGSVEDSGASTMLPESEPLKCSISNTLFPHHPRGWDRIQVRQSL